MSIFQGFGEGSDCIGGFKQFQPIYVKRKFLEGPGTPCLYPVAHYPQPESRASDLIRMLGRRVLQAWCWLWVGCLPTIPGLTRPRHLDLPFEEVELSGILRSFYGVEVLCNGVEPGIQLPLLLSFCQLSLLRLTVRQSWNLEVFCIGSEGSKPCCPEGKSSCVWI